MDTDIGQIYRSYVKKQQVAFSNIVPWFNYIPIFNWFAPYLESEQKFDIKSYSFESMPYATNSGVLSKSDSSYGYISVSLTQGQYIESVYYSVPTIMGILSVFGG